MTARTMRCPSCGSEIVAHEGWVPWCTSCDWGVDPTPEEPSYESRLERWWRGRLNRVSALEHQELLAHGLGARARDGAFVIALATAVHLVTLHVAAALVLVLVSGLPLVAKVLLGLLLLGVLWEVGPHPGRSSQLDGVRLDATTAPETHRLVSEVAGRLGVEPPHEIVVDDDVNASWGPRGWRRRRTLVLGLPLWAALSGQEKVALLGHEVGHEASGDPRRGWYVGSAVVALDAWRELLTPTVDEVHDGGFYGIVIYVAQWVVVVAMIPILALLALLEVVLGTLALRSGQRAEHIADRLGAQLAGKDGGLGCTRALVRVESLRFALGVALRKDARRDVWDAAREHIASVPVHEQERLLRRATLTLQRVDESHPPSSRRLELLAQAADTPAEITLDPEREALVDAEIRSASAWVARRVRERET